MAYLPSLSVFASCFTPWSLTARTVRPAQGFAFRSKITPLIDPVCAEAPGARTETNAPTMSAADTKKLSALFMPISPFKQRRGLCCPPRRRAPIISELDLMPSLRLCCYRSPEGNWIRYPSFSECPQAQQATVASATGCIFALIAGPRQMQWGPELDAAPNYFTLLQFDHRRDNIDSFFRACTGANQVLQLPVICGPTSLGAGAVL